MISIAGVQVADRNVADRNKQVADGNKQNHPQIVTSYPLQILGTCEVTPLNSLLGC